MSRRQSRRKPMADINVVPYIDVTFVLLIIFMITAPLVQTGVDVELPQAEARTVDSQDIPPLIITVDKRGQYFIDTGDNENEPVAAQDLLVIVAAVRRQQPETQIYIRGDKQVDYGKVVTVMSALKSAGIKAVGLMTQPLT